MVESIKAYRRTAKKQAMTQNPVKPAATDVQQSITQGSATPQVGQPGVLDVSKVNMDYSSAVTSSQSTQIDTQNSPTASYKDKIMQSQTPPALHETAPPTQLLNARTSIFILMAITLFPT